MYQNYVVEVKKFHNGEYEHNVFWLYDADADKAMLKAKSKWHEIMSQAAVSNTAEHAAILFTSEGFPVLHECYKHEVQPEPVEQTEPVEGE